jgi:hypothetical protein
MYSTAQTGSDSTARREHVERLAPRRPWGRSDQLRRHLMSISAPNSLVVTFAISAVLAAVSLASNAQSQSETQH